MTESMSRRAVLAALALPAVALRAGPGLAQPLPRMQSWPLATPQRTGIHDVAPAPDGGVWFSAQRSGHLGWFDPKTVAPSWSRSAPDRRRTA